MTDRATLEGIINTLYAARSVNDIDALMSIRDPASVSASSVAASWHRWRSGSANRRRSIPPCVDWLLTGTCLRSRPPGFMSMAIRFLPIGQGRSATGRRGNPHGIPRPFHLQGRQDHRPDRIRRYIDGRRDRRFGSIGKTILNDRGFGGGDKTQAVPSIGRPITSAAFRSESSFS